MVEELRALAVPGDSPGLRSLGDMVEMKIHERRGDFEAAAGVLRRQRALLLASPVHRPGLAILEGNLAIYLNHLGAHAEAEALMRETLARPGRSRRMTQHVYQLVYALARQGRGTEAHAVAREHRADLAAHAASVELNGREALAALAWSRGRLDDAWRILGPMASTPPSAGVPRLGLDPLLVALRSASEDGGADADTVARWGAEGALLDPLALLTLAIDGPTSP
jgi:hypothetical protein